MVKRTEAKPACDRRRRLQADILEFAVAKLVAHLGAKDVAKKAAPGRIETGLHYQKR